MTTPSGDDALAPFVRSASPLVTPSGVAFARAGADQILEPAIDPDDTYVLADLTMQPAPPEDNPLGIAYPVESHHVETGYTTEGEIVFSDFRTDPPGNPYTSLVDEVRTVRMVGYDVSMYDVNGQPYPIEDPGLVASVQELIETDGTQVTDGLVLDELDPPNGATAHAADGTGTRVVTSTKGGRVETTTRTNGQRQKTTRRYKRQGSVYVMESAETVVEDAQGRRLGGMSVAVSNVTWKRNRGKDEGRRERRGRPMPPRPPVERRGALSECDPGRPNRPEWCENSGGGEGTGGPATPNTTDPCPSTTSGTFTVVFQHGILSDKSAWGAWDRGTGVRSEVRCAFSHFLETNTTLPANGLVSHRQQIDHLKSMTSGNRQVLIGHSQGGVVSRRMAQEWQQANATTPGSAPTALAVVTLDTPHQGAIIADNLANPVVQAIYAATFAALYPLIAIVPTRFSPSVSVLVGSLVGGPPPFNDATVGSSDAVRDLKRGSASIQTMNTGYENFYRIGIRNTPKNRWMPFRLAGDMSRKGGGVAHVRKAESFYQDMRTVALFGLVIPVGGWIATGGAVIIMTAMNGADSGLRALAADGEPYDGTVSKTSQTYPNTPGQYVPVNYSVVDAVSHTGVQKSDEAARQVVRMLNESGLQLPGRSQP